MEEAPWTLDQLGSDTPIDGRIPSVENTRQLVREYRNTWVFDSRAPDVSRVVQWLLERLEILPSEFTWERFKIAMKEEQVKLIRLQYFVDAHSMGGEAKNMLYETSNVQCNMKDVLKHAARAVVNLSPSNLDAREQISQEDFQTMDIDNENMFHHTEKNNTNFQNAFFHLRHVLEGCNFKKAGGKFWRRIQLPGGLDACAYQEVCTIEEFVETHTSYDSNFKPWRWITNPTSNFNHMVDYLKERTIMEALSLSENTHLRSFAGDEEGKSSGVYNHAQDMFFPYDRVHEWDTMAMDVQAKRKELFDPKYVCTAPSMDEVAVVHLQCAFPFDIYAEVMAVDPFNLPLAWVEVDEWECAYRCFSPQSVVASPSLAALVASRADDAYSCEGSKNSFPRPRARLTEEEWATFGVEGITCRSILIHGDRYFRVHTGYMWFDIQSEDIDHIYRCQDFVDHDRFMLYAICGRLFYKVGERDSFEGTIFFIGTGGCGKSTLAKIYQYFWPPHRRGSLSSNIQAQFGMANVAKGDVAWCTELSEEPNMPQEDWQDATSGHTVVCPVKHKQEPVVVIAWHAQFWWSSNVFPKRYKNGQGQVSRRLYGVAMYKPVKPRKDNIVKNIVPALGHILRKSVLAYDDWLMQQGNIDPMSHIEDLPPAFSAFYRKTRRETDPMEEFLSDGAWVVEEVGAKMPMSVLRILFNEYRIHFEMGRMSRWSEDVYRSAFTERGIQVIKKANIDWNGDSLTEVDVVIGLRPK